MSLFGSDKKKDKTEEANLPVESQGAPAAASEAKGKGKGKEEGTITTSSDLLVQAFGDIDAGVKRMKLVVIAVAALAAVAICAAFFFVATTIKTAKDNVYILSKDETYYATKSPTAADAVTKTDEIDDFIVRFHELFFNLSPNMDIMKINEERAYAMCGDNSAYLYHNRLEESGFFKNFVQYNMSQEVVVDSIHVNTKDYPYAVRMFGRQIVVRESNATMFSLVTTCNVMDVARSPSNLHGLVLRNFFVEKNEKMKSEQIRRR